MTKEGNAISLPVSGPSVTSADPLAPDLVPALHGYRVRVAAALLPFRDDVDVWERHGHLPRELFSALATAKVFRERWAAGAVGGLPMARVLVEELAAHNGGAALAVSIHSEVFMHALHAYGGPAHAEVLSGALDGGVVGCVALTEPSGGSDLQAMSTAAVRDGATGWRLTGIKRYTTNAGRATHGLVLARTGTGPHAFSLFLVALDRPGVKVTRFFTTMGMRSADTGELHLDVTLDDADVVGRVDAGLLYVLRLLDFERIAAASGLVAAARSGLALTAAHLRQRVQFGKRLFDHQALAHRLADRWADVEAAAALLGAACEAANGDSLPHHLVAAAKMVAAKAGTRALDEAIQLFGGRGYTEDYPLERMYRDARLARIGGGTDEMLRTVICAHLDVPDAAASVRLEEIAERHVSV